MFFVYVIESESDGRYYIGQTDNLDARIKRHNQGRNLSTKAYIPWRLKWWKGFETRSGAVKMERKLKSLKKRSGIERAILVNDFNTIGL